VIWNHTNEEEAGGDEAGKITKSQASLNKILSSTLRRKRMEKKNNIELRIYDVGGGEKIRGIWPNYYAEVKTVSKR
jgi:hypothetical protein